MLIFKLPLFCYDWKLKYLCEKYMSSCCNVPYLAIRLCLSLRKEEDLHAKTSIFIESCASKINVYSI